MVSLGRPLMARSADASRGACVPVAVSTLPGILLDASDSRAPTVFLDAFTAGPFFRVGAVSLGGDKAARTVLLDALAAEVAGAFGSGWIVILDEKKVRRRTEPGGEVLTISYL